MTIGLIGKKCGMTRVFTEDGASIPVTVLNVLPNRIVQIKSEEKDGYSAIQVAMGSKRASKLTKPVLGHYTKASVEPGEKLCEFLLAPGEEKDLAVGSELKADMFQVGAMVDITGRSKGKGFAGVVKKYNFCMQDATHGNSLSHRAPGSIGQRQDPGKVFKGKKMAGHMGDVKRTVQNQEIVRIDLERSLILVRGVVPGAPNGVVMIRPSVKQKGERHGA